MLMRLLQNSSQILRLRPNPQASVSVSGELLRSPTERPAFRRVWINRDLMEFDQAEPTPV